MPPKSRMASIKCWLRGYHVTNTGVVFRLDAHGMCRDCGTVGTGVRSSDVEFERAEKE
jgi:hypothetical protein